MKKFIIVIGIVVLGIAIYSSASRSTPDGVAVTLMPPPPATTTPK